MIGEQWTIYWNEYSANTFIHGVDIIYHSKNNVEYRGELIPPGTVIKKWFSKTIYQATRIEPTLPMIDGEMEYCIESDMEADGGGCYLRLVFYDRYDQEAGSIVIRDKKKHFRCPMKTYSYELQLINAGATVVNFHSVIIREEVVDEK